MTMNVDAERKKVQLAAAIIEVEEKGETCRIELNFQAGKLVSGNKFLGFLK